MRALARPPAGFQDARALPALRAAPVYAQPHLPRPDNFLSLDGPGPGTGIRLVPNGGIARASEGALDLQQGENGIHRVSNPFDERAVSLHVYSRPYDTCIAYDPAVRTAREMRLYYHSVGGKLVDAPAEQWQ